MRSVAESLRTERALLTGILEEREHNMILIMNAFSRVGKLAQVRERRAGVCVRLGA